jgi:hypothetical protein
MIYDLLSRYRHNAFLTYFVMLCVCRGDEKYMISRQPKLSLGCRVRLQIKDVLYRWRFELGGKAIGVTVIR